MKKEISQGTEYNVAETIEAWAKARIDNWTPEQRKAIEDEFANRARAFHGERIRARAIANS